MYYSLALAPPDEEEAAAEEAAPGTAPSFFLKRPRMYDSSSCPALWFVDVGRGATIHVRDQHLSVSGKYHGTRSIDRSPERRNGTEGDSRVVLGVGAIVDLAVAAHAEEVGEEHLAGAVVVPLLHAALHQGQVCWRRG